jgi:NAD(P)-dependent dehydrogenase (short-subunit alcohol dehydrogenase family)/acyl dehydratase/putative sterol carrier protein
LTFNQDQFKDKVVVITGAGGGIGRSHALAFAKAGAKVVVNDLGSSRDGKGATTNMADQVVNEIKELGGEATANYDSVADVKGAENIIRTAMDAYGRIDFLINNAGILRDKTFLKMTDEMWDLVIAVHLKGTYAVTKAAAPIMKEQKFGRIVNTTSMSGLLGNFGQANYSAAKAGVYGFTRTLSMELERYGITVNAIAPVAKTRMTDDIDAVPDDAKPDQITPMVMYLCSDEAKEVNGRVFGIHGQHLFEYYMEQTQGFEKKSPELWSLKEIHEKFEEITDRNKGKEPAGDSNIDSLIPKLNEVIKGLGIQISKIGELPTTAPVTAAPTLSDMFQKFTEVFIPEKAAGFEGLIQFEIEGDQPQAIYIKDGKVTIKAEKGSNPECTITTDKESMLDMLHGKSDPTKLFMKGKIKADKMPVLMKFGTMFDIPKLPEKVKSLEQSTTPSQPQEVTAPSSFVEMFQILKKVFVPEKAGGFNGAILFLVSGEDPQSIYVENQKVEIKSEKAENPVLTIRTDKETFEALFKGETDAPKSLMQGKIKADRMNLLMKFGNMFNLNEIPKILAGSVTTTIPTKKADGINRDYIGRWFYGEATHVKPEKIKQYAMATNDKNPVYFKDNPNEQLVPPIFPVTLNGDLLEKFLTQEDDLNLDFSRMVHGEQEIIYYEPLRPWDLVYPVAQITDIETKESGETMTIRVDGKVKGNTKFSMNVKLFVRAKGGKKSAKKKEEKPDLGKPFFSEVMKVEPDQAKRYAEASGDNNPIHLDPEFAKSVGLPDVILHGLCTMAFASQAIVKHMCDNDPRRLKRMSVRFSRPVLMTDVLTTNGWLAKKEGNTKIITFEMVNQKGEKVLTNGSATIALK